MKFRLPLVLFLACLGGCATHTTLYEWGSYQGELYTHLVEPEQGSIAQQIQKLEQHIQKAQDRGRQVPPGLHAHLGYLYFQSGQRPSAIAQLQREKQLFPESGPYMDRLITKLQTP